MNELDLILAEYKNFVVTITVPHFGSGLVEKYLRELCHNSNFTTVPPKGRGVPTTKTFVVKYSNYQSAMVNQFNNSLRQIFNPDYLKFTITEESRFQDLWQLYTHLLETHDWYYEMSDDHSVWRSGNSANNRIKLIRLHLQTIDRLRADDLYNARCPFNKA
jgi:hypothetical protein